jgi:hypothetical protein
MLNKHRFAAFNQLFVNALENIMWNQFYRLRKIYNRVFK